ncbi:hypothetical protein CHS0354_019955 [Potamilus streckersoni]|uniref:G-patch domain-containing protein n=1 Tax=Potamilus streckersoni TaxID=2493646 RepID=A0AAE0S0P3_9BIVA|nr:hypothetical protein CHS0354_019955 [Potamilus streckersoni]
MASEIEAEKTVYAIINNIPPDHHSSDLRNYFSQFIESRGFQCFHFRHRPEAQRTGNETDVQQQTSSHSSFKRTTCCVIKLKDSKLKELIKMYHRKHWLDKKDESIPSLCSISKIRVQNKKNESAIYKTRDEQKKIPPDREEFTEEDLLELPELHPPDIMPNGNVGTPTMVFLEFIRQCRLPPAVIKKLGLIFPKTRTNKKYGSVPFSYGGEVVHGHEEGDITVLSASGQEIESSKTTDFTESSSPRELHVDAENKESDKSKNAHKISRRKKKIDAEMRKIMNERIEEKMIEKERSKSDSEEDNDSCEEWERHEALCDDPSNQERNTERLFEEDIELKWEKGGSGLVFYTDAQYWQEQEGDFDEQTADDWDVDMSTYYEEGAGDKDARDYLAIRQEQRRRAGLENTDRFTIGVATRKHKTQPPNGGGSPSLKIGKFEQHTKGIGRKIMEKHGWTEGQGLGSSVGGIADALENDGQHPRDKKGFGYHGKKINRYVHQKKPAAKEVIISTVYDNPAVTDPAEPLHRRNNPYTLKYRDEVLFQKATCPQNDSENG